MFVPANIEDIPKQKRKHGENIKELQDFLDSGLRAAQYVLREGEKPESKIACFKTAATRMGFPIILTRKGNEIFFVRKEE